MPKKEIACFSPGNPMRMLDEIMYKLGEYDHLVTYMRRIPCELETHNVRLNIFTQPQQLKGRQFDEIFGFPVESVWPYRKNKKLKPFTGSLINYILREEGLINADDIYY